MYYKASQLSYLDLEIMIIDKNQISLKTLFLFTNNVDYCAGLLLKI
ncbi:conserved hypothetical protein [Acinetobacter proteolyticus]|jgi:hypothetical protein|uniref:Uncharacterized protein n=1 Tax=Acinetobacter proteolyticus TaxID=1776741 RepID=A0A653K262_9GAMM|nr:conserved hypothetical protein [Acinetobacter proteolyticus]